MGYDRYADTRLLRLAFMKASKWHAGQQRRSGEPYIIHPLTVSGILADWRMDVGTIVAGLLHDSVEDMLNPDEALKRVVQYQSAILDILDDDPLQKTVTRRFAQIEAALQTSRKRTHISREAYNKSAEAINLLQKELRPVPAMKRRQIRSILDTVRDVTEGPDTRLEKIRLNFSDEIADIVNGVSKISDIKLKSREQQQVDNFRKLLLSITHDVRVLLVKFADRLHNIRTLEHLNPEKRERIARETLEVYAPLAVRFGMGKLRRDLEDESFKHLNPEEYEKLQSHVESMREQLEGYRDNVCAPLEELLHEKGIPAKVEGRVKHLFSIRQKMRRREKTFDEIYDLLAIRIIIDDSHTDTETATAKCYEALGYIHSRYNPLPGRLKDFIGNPKPNGYRSLHTTVRVDKGTVFEVQIRTLGMHRIAEVGVARHWMYKEGRVTRDIDEETSRVREILMQMEEERDPGTFLEQLKLELFPDEVFIVSPKGDVYHLPRGATPLDYAFAIHSEIGLHCSSAQVNGTIVPLNYQLRSGETVKIITHPSQKPSRDWLSIVRTGKARHRIKRWLKAEEFPFHLHLGQNLLEKALKKAGYKVDDAEWDKLCTSFAQSDVNHLYAAVGSGEVSVSGILSHLRQQRPEKPSAEDDQAKQLPPDSDLANIIDLSGLDNTMAHSAPCCSPIPGDEIIGFVTRGRGLSIHRKDCSNITSLMQEPDRVVAVKWGIKEDDPANVKPFTAMVIVFTSDSLGQLAKITNAIANKNVNIRQAQATSDSEGGVIKLTLDVQGRLHLNDIIRSLRDVPGVTKVDRQIAFSSPSTSASKAG